VYGFKLLAILFTTQHILKGFVMSLCVTASDFLLKEHKLPGPQLQMYKAIIALPWALKPLMGILSDTVPVFGYRKSPYIFLVTLLGVSGFLLVATSDESMPLVFVVAGLFLGNLHVSTCDLLTEAKYSERLKQEPTHGPDLVSYVWGGVTFGSFVAVSMTGYLIEQHGTRFVYGICAAASGSVLIPTMMNFLEEDVMTKEEAVANRRRIWDKEREVIVLSVVVALCVVSLASVGLITQSVKISFYTSIVVAAVILSSFTIFLRPAIGTVNAFYFIQTTCALAIDGATFYFFTDSSEAYADGPHFSVFFYTTVVGLIAASFNMVGLFTYNKYTKTIKYRHLFVVTNAILGLLNLLSVLLYSRILKPYISDRAFVLSASVLQSTISTWMWMPGVVLMAQLCPVGMEAAMYALLAGCHNIGSSVAQAFGAFMLESLGVTPNGTDGDAAKMSHLWIASLISSVVPLFSIFLVPYCVPDAFQTDTILLDAPESATKGSPWERWNSSAYVPVVDEELVEDGPSNSNTTTTASDAEGLSTEKRPILATGSLQR
jgi:folate/biopterin transporter